MSATEPEDTSQETAAPEATALIHPFDEKPDETLVDLMLKMKISDRLRSLCRHVRAQRGFHTV